MGTSNNETESGQDYINEEANLGGTSIEAFFAASVIFITGATGFLGKALLEKLLRSCSRISTIYILIRPKKGLTLEERFESLMGNSVFDRIRWECPSAFRKVIAIKGDVSKPELGLSEEDRIMLTQTVNMIFHVAATVRFDEPLKVAVNLNTRGTQRLMELASNMLNLISFVHVSTAYSNADKKEVKEIIYKTAVKPETAIEMCENLNDETLNILEKLLRDKHPNTYTLTKGLAEDIIMRKMTDLPIAIVRPSIVCAAYQEPFPGWVDNVFGITGILMEILRGTIRSIVCNDKLIVDVVPVDYVVDTLITAAWHIGMRRNNNIQVYNCVSSAFNPITWKDFGKLSKKYAIESPTRHAMWYPGFTFTTNRFIHNVASAMFHFLPAFIVDLALRFKGGKPIMMKLTRRFERAAKTGEFFTVNEWHFHGENMQQLVKSVKAANDANNFNVDIATLDWDNYVQQYMLGIRKYILNDSPDTLTNARSRISKCVEKLFIIVVYDTCGVSGELYDNRVRCNMSLRFYWMHKSLQAIIVFSLVKILSRR